MTSTTHSSNISFIAVAPDESRAGCDFLWLPFQFTSAVYYFPRDARYAAGPLS